MFDPVIALKLPELVNVHIPKLYVIGLEVQLKLPELITALGLPAVKFTADEVALKLPVLVKFELEPPVMAKVAELVNVILPLLVIGFEFPELVRVEASNEMLPEFTIGSGLPEKVIVVPLNACTVPLLVNEQLLPPKVKVVLVSLIVPEFVIDVGEAEPVVKVQPDDKVSEP